MRVISEEHYCSSKPVTRAVYQELGEVIHETVAARLVSLSSPSGVQLFGCGPSETESAVAEDAGAAPMAVDGAAAASPTLDEWRATPIGVDVSRAGAVRDSFSRVERKVYTRKDRQPFVKKTFAGASEPQAHSLPQLMAVAFKVDGWEHASDTSFVVAFKEGSRRVEDITVTSRAERVETQQDPDKAAARKALGDLLRTMYQLGPDTARMHLQSMNKTARQDCGYGLGVAMSQMRREKDAVEAIMARLAAAEPVV